MQRLACVCIAGAMRACPISELEGILGFTLLHLIIDRVSKETLLRMTRSTNEKIDLKDSKIVLKSNPILGTCRDDIEKKFVFDKYFKSELTMKREWLSVTTTLSKAP